MTSATTIPGDVMTLLRRAVAIADAAAYSDIEANADLVSGPDGERWYDVRPMLSEKEHSLEAIDLATEALHYALQRGLASRPTGAPHLVRLHPQNLKPMKERTHG